MRSSLRRGDGKLGVLSGHGLAQSHDEVSGQKGTVSRSAENPLRIGPVSCDPIEPGQDFGKRTWIVLDPIGNDRQAKRRKAQGIAIGAEKQAFALRRKPRYDAGQNRAPANFAERLIAAAYSPRPTAGEQDARHPGRFSRHRRRPLVSGKRTSQGSDRTCPVFSTTAANAGSPDRTAQPRSLAGWLTIRRAPATKGEGARD